MNGERIGKDIFTLRLSSFHLFQRVVGFRHDADYKESQETFGGFHLFQRVVGFRHGKETTKELKETFESFHLFQRVVGFRRYDFGRRY